MDGRPPPRWPLLALLLALFGPSAAAAAPAFGAVAQAVAAGCRDATVVILGERHGEPESHALFLELVEALAESGARLLVALENPGDRIGDLRAALAGFPAPEFPVVDGPSFRELLRTLGGAASRPSILGIDAPTGGGGTRDEAMAATLGDAVRSGRYDRIVVLVGNSHALKTVPWNPQLRSPPHKLAERLVDQGVAVASLVQWFPERGCGMRVARYYRPDDPEARAAVRDLWSRMNTETQPALVGAAAAAAAADGVVAWSCPPISPSAKTTTGHP